LDRSFGTFWQGLKLLEREYGRPQIGDWLCRADTYLLCS